MNREGDVTVSLAVVQALGANSAVLLGLIINTSDPITGECVLSNKELGDLTGLHHGTVKRCLRGLAAQDLINIPTKKIRDGSIRPNILMLHRDTRKWVEHTLRKDPFFRTGSETPGD